MKLSKNFKLIEFTRSQEAKRLQINNTPSKLVVQELQALVINILQPLRGMVGKTINVSSGYRSKELNKQIGGAKKSQHVLGQAADIECFGLGNAALARMIYDHFSYDRLILEFHDPTKGPNDGWVHVSHRMDGNNAGKSFRAVKDANNNTQYLPLDW